MKCQGIKTLDFIFYFFNYSKQNSRAQKFKFFKKKKNGEITECLQPIVSVLRESPYSVKLS